MTSSDRWISVSTDYVSPRPSAAGDAWQEEAARQGRVGTHRLREVAEVQPPSEVAQALGLQAAERAVVRRRIVLLDDHPVELVDSYYPLAIASGTPLAEPGKIRGGAVTLLAHMGYGIERLREDVSARMPTQEEWELLQLSVNHPVLSVVRLAMDASASPVEVTTMVMADGRHLRYELAR